jgi:hypothetical protein
MWQKPKIGCGSYNIGLLTIHEMEKQRDQIQSFMALSESMKDVLKRLAFKMSK